MRNLYIGLDRAGTLELPGLPPPLELSERLAELQDDGARIFVASGKRYEVLQRACAALDLTPWMYCCENGGHLVFPHSGFEYVADRDPDLAFFVRYVDTLPLPASEREAKRTIWSSRFGKSALVAKSIIDDFVRRQGLALDVYSYPERDGTIDVVPQSIDKANLIRYVPPAAVIHYFGDDENDLGIMRDSRVTPHTVANAKPVVKHCVAGKRGLISELPAGLGVADVLEQLDERFPVSYA
jgi:hydroxymethylpyrimidine pyrophosphatase-like HAD family hydrolase